MQLITGCAKAVRSLPGMKRAIAFSLLLSCSTAISLPLQSVKAGETAVAATSAARKSDRRLPADIVPLSYDLRLKPDLERGTFSGSETVEIRIEHPVTQVFLNAKDLILSDATLTASGTGAGAATKVQIDMLPDDEMVAFQTGSTIEPGQYRLSVNYSSKLNDKLVGFYKSSFKDSAGKVHPLATTQFEPADARRMLPCFDEPQMKARFHISVEMDKKYVAISNAPTERNVVESSGRRVVQFNQTPPMSSYLLALAVGEFQATPPIVVHGVPVRVWSVAGKSAMGMYSRDAAAKLLPALNSYFGIDYPWTKLDLVALPDFEAGAMENPGCITFRETLLLIDPKTASSSAQRSCTSVIAHEMAHMWFGDLVTMRWWDDLWLNEAFATFMATRVVNTVYPAWDFWKGYIEERSAALVTDGLHSTRAIHAPVTCPDQAVEMFDVITYEKGASILRMLERYVGEQKFQGGIHKYLKDHSYGNATTEELWQSIATVSGAPVKQVMNGWVNQPGYPILTVQHAEGSKVTFSQQRFFLAGPDAADKTIWDVPIGVRPLSEIPGKKDQTDARTKLLLDSTLKTFEDVPSVSGPFIANAGGVGYYRLRYPASDMAAIRAKLQTNLDPGERLSIIDDSWNLAVAGQIPISQYLELLTAYKTESDDTVWEQILHSLGSLNRFVTDNNRPDYERFMRSVLGPIHQQLGWQPLAGESQRRRILRGNVIEELGTTAQDPSTIQRARALFSLYLKDRTKVDPDLVSAISEIVAYNGNSKDYENFQRLYQTARSPEEEHRNLFVLASFANPALSANTMNLSINGKVKIQDAPHLLGSILGHRRTTARAWEFIQKNWDKIHALYSEPMIPGLVSRASCFSTPQQYTELQRFLADHPIPSGETAVKRTLESVKINIGFRDRSATELNTWLHSHYGAAQESHK
jgi:puromycin-sensitive aminopeptidase